MSNAPEPERTRIFLAQSLGYLGLIEIMTHASPIRKSIVANATIPGTSSGVFIDVNTTNPSNVKLEIVVHFKPIDWQEMVKSQALTRFNEQHGCQTEVDISSGGIIVAQNRADIAQQNLPAVLFQMLSTVADFIGAFKDNLV